MQSYIFISYLQQNRFPACIKKRESKLPFHFKARTRLGPLIRFHHPVAVEVRTQVAVAHHLRDAREIRLQHPHQNPQRTLLQLRARIRRAALLIQSPFVRDADAPLVVAPCMRPGPFHRTHGADFSVRAHIVMIAAALEAPFPVHPGQFSRRERTIRPRCCTMNHNHVNFSHHNPVFSRSEGREYTSVP